MKIESYVNPALSSCPRRINETYLVERSIGLRTIGKCLTIYLTVKAERSCYLTLSEQADTGWIGAHH